MSEQRPPAQEEMIYQLWFAIKGANGDGIWETVRRIESRVADLEKIAATREELRVAMEKAERDDAAQDERAEHAVNFYERRKGHKIALAAFVVSAVVNLAVAFVGVIGG